VVSIIRIPYPEMVARIKEKTGLPDEDINARVEGKLRQLSGLISKEGAAYIIASELGVRLLEAGGKVKDIFAGMRNAQLVARVTQAFPQKQFRRADGSEGKLLAFTLADDTGSIRAVAWGSQADTASRLKPGDAVKVIGAVVKEGMNGARELHINEQSRLAINPPDENPPQVQVRPARQPKALKDLVDGDENVEVTGTLLDLSEPRFFEVCPQCNSRLQPLDAGLACGEHGPVQPDYGCTLGLTLDDGTGRVRVVLFRNQAERLLGLPRQELAKFRENPLAFSEYQTKLLGEQYKFVGRAKLNTFSNSVEFIAQLIFPAEAPQAGTPAPVSA
jgi:replication factor A1